MGGGGPPQRGRGRVGTAVMTFDQFAALIIGALALYAVAKGFFLAATIPAPDLPDDMDAERRLAELRRLIDGP